MSREKECKCCHEWWYASVIKEDLCPNCYDYFKQLKHQLAEKDKMHLLDEQEFQHYCAYKQIEPAIKGCLDREREYEKQVVEKDKEIEKLKQQYTILENENGKLTTELIMDKYKKAQKEVSFGKQLAMQELEKVKDTLKHFCEIHSDEFYGVKSQVKGIEQDVCEEIDNQIKVLKGE